MPGLQLGPARRRGVSSAGVRGCGVLDAVRFVGVWVVSLVSLVGWERGVLAVVVVVVVVGGVAVGLG